MSETNLIDDLIDPAFPPLLRGEEAATGQDPFAKAVAAAALGTDAGLIVWARGSDRLDAAMVLAPEVPLDRAMGAVLALANGLADAIGALGPPEVAVHFDWPGTLRVNGAVCGRMRAASSTDDPERIPDWLVIGVEVAYLPPDRSDGGERPEVTSLIEEGCGDLTPLRLLESWSRHCLVWLNTLLDRGMAPVHAAWCGRAWKMGEPLADGNGTFMGLDENGGMLVRDGETTRLRPLTDMLE